MYKTLCTMLMAMMLLVPGAFANDAGQGVDAPPPARGFRAALKRAAQKAAKATKKAVAKTKKVAKQAAAKTKEVAKKAVAKTKEATKKAVAKTKVVAQKTAKVAKQAATKTKEVAKEAAAKTKVAAQKAGAALKRAATRTKDVVKQAVEQVRSAVRGTPPPSPPPAVTPATSLPTSKRVLQVPGPTGEITRVTEPTHTLVAPKGSVFSSILNSGQVRVCVRTDVPPFGYFVGQSLYGFDITLAKKIVDGMSIRYHKTLAIQWNVINAKGRIPALKQGRCDLVIAAFSKTPARAKKVAFSTTYLRTSKVLIAKASVTRSKPVLAVVTGTTTPSGQIVPGAVVTDFFNYNEILSAMQRGYVDYVLTDHPTAAYLVRKSKGYKIQQILEQQENYAIGLHKHHTYLRKEVNAILHYLARSGYLSYFKRSLIK